MALHTDSKSPWSWDRFGVGDLEFGIWGEGELVRRGRAQEGEGESAREGEGSVSCEGEREMVRSLFNDCVA